MDNGAGTMVSRRPSKTFLRSARPALIWRGDSQDMEAHERREMGPSTDDASSANRKLPTEAEGGFDEEGLSEGRAS
jgi:hypothetical protein